MVLSGNAEGLVTNRRIDGTAGSDREVFDLVEAWSCEPAFQELFDGARESAS